MSSRGQGGASRTWNQEECIKTQGKRLCNSLLYINIDNSFSPFILFTFNDICQIRFILSQIMLDPNQIQDSNSKKNNRKELFFHLSPGFRLKELGDGSMGLHQPRIRKDNLQEKVFHSINYWYKYTSNCLDLGRTIRIYLLCLSWIKRRSKGDST